MSLIDDVLKTLQAGFALYHGEVQESVYKTLRCPDAKRARWFVRDRGHLCLGCQRKCSLADPTGFQLMLPTPVRTEIAFAALPMVTDEELLRAKLFLRVDEAAHVLRISGRQVYRLLDEALLDRHPDAPVRILTASIREYIEQKG